jgi:signal transduction histidine kinase
MPLSGCDVKEELKGERMAQVDLKRDQGEQTTILKDMLHVIAHGADPRTGIGHLLNLLRGVSGGRGATLILFAEPHINLSSGNAGSLPSEDTLRDFAETVPPEITLNPPLWDGAAVESHWAAASVRRNQQVVGLVWLVFDQRPVLGGERAESLHALMDGLTILTLSILSTARHEKLARNQSEFMRIVSHDLRSPLTSIQGFASMLEQGTVGELNERQAYFVEKILSGVTQMSSLVDNIQDAGRYDPETGFYEMQRSACDLTEMVRRIVENHLLPAEKQELTIVTRISDNVPIINADANMLERAIINLVDNAIKYTPNGGQIEVGVERQDETLMVSVHDNGLGISPENQKLLFERHVRIPRQEHKKIKGSGLGLFIVKSVARRHGGDAWVTSREGKGSTFFIGIPLDGVNAVVSGDTTTHA